jgi:hypothetical protein
MKEMAEEPQQQAAVKPAMKEDINGISRAEGNDEGEESTNSSGARLMAAPQISPVKPLSPMAPLDIA